MIPRTRERLKTFIEKERQMEREREREKERRMATAAYMAQERRTPMHTDRDSGGERCRESETERERHKRGEQMHIARRRGNCEACATVFRCNVQPVAENLRPDMVIGIQNGIQNVQS